MAATPSGNDRLTTTTGRNEASEFAIQPIASKTKMQVYFATAQKSLFVKSRTPARKPVSNSFSSLFR
jgi:hypothetical protein